MLQGLAGGTRLPLKATSPTIFTDFHLGNHASNGHSTQGREMDQEMDPEDAAEDAWVTNDGL